MDKRKLAAALALGGSIAIVSLFGGSDEPVSGSYRGGYYASSGSYRQGVPETGQWNGKDFVVVLTADDGFDVNLNWSAAADSMGFTYTMCISERDTGDAGRVTTADIATIAGRGVEIASTGRGHAFFGYVSLSASDPSYPDSLLWYLSPSWIYAWTEIDYSVSTFIIDIGSTNYPGTYVMRDSSYIGARGSYHGYPGIGRTAAPGQGYWPGLDGEPRWDFNRFLRTDETSTPYSYASFRGEDETDPTNAIFGGILEEGNLASVKCDSVKVRINRALDVSAANGYPPVAIVIHAATVTREEIECMVEHLRGRGDVWIANQEEMLAEYRSDFVPVDPPGWAVFGKLEGLTAADSIFWGTAPTTYSCATDSFIFTTGTTIVDTLDYTAIYADSLTFGGIRPDFPTLVEPGGNVLKWDIQVLPVTGIEDLALLGFDLSPVAGKTVVFATLGWYTTVGVDISTSDQNFYSITGITDEEILWALQQSDFNYTYRVDSAATAWALSWADYEWPTAFGDFVYPFTATSAGAVETDVSDYVRYVVDNGLYRAGFLWTGNKADGSQAQRLGPHNDNVTGQRPYLIVGTCQ